MPVSEGYYYIIPGCNSRIHIILYIYNIKKESTALVNILKPCFT